MPKDVKISLKLNSTDHPIRCIVALGTSTCCQMKVFLLSRKNERFISQITDGSEVSALARLTFDENLLIGGERGVRCPH